jgi:hypothetical protein
MMRTQLRKLLFEAYRRDDMADARERSKPLHERWLGLGTEAAYRPAIEAGLMRFHDGRTPPPRCMGWLVLTPAGISTLWGLRREFEEQLAGLKRTRYPQQLRAQYQLCGGLCA